MTLQDIFDIIDANAKAKKILAEDDFKVAELHCKKGIFDRWYSQTRDDKGLAYNLGWEHANETYKNSKVQFLDYELPF